VVNQSKEDGVVTRQDQRLGLGSSINKKKVKEGTMGQHGLQKEDGVESRQGFGVEEGTRVRQAFQDLLPAMNNPISRKAAMKNWGKRMGKSASKSRGHH